MIVPFSAQSSEVYSQGLPLLDSPGNGAISTVFFSRKIKLNIMADHQKSGHKTGHVPTGSRAQKSTGLSVAPRRGTLGTVSMKTGLTRNKSISPKSGTMKFTGPRHFA